jgi:hypothetical protein
MELSPQRELVFLGGGGGTSLLSNLLVRLVRPSILKPVRILTYLGRERNLPSRKGTTGTWLASVNCSERDQMMGQRQEKFMT